MTSHYAQVGKLLAEDTIYSIRARDPAFRRGAVFGTARFIPADESDMDARWRITWSEPGIDATDLRLGQEWPGHFAVVDATIR